MHSLSVSKNPVALDVLISRECLADLCSVLDTALTSDSHSQALLLSNAVDCIWSVVGAQDQIAKVTCCVTMSDIGITPHMLSALSATIRAHDTLSTDDFKFALVALSFPLLSVLTHPSSTTPQNSQPRGRCVADTRVGLLASVQTEPVHTRGHCRFVSHVTFAFVFLSPKTLHETQPL